MDFAVHAQGGVFELLHTGIALLSAEGNFIYANKAFREMFGLSEKLLGRHVAEFFLTAEQGAMTTIRTGKITVNSSVTTRNAQGVSFRYPILNGEGSLLGVIIESISAGADRDKLSPLLDAVRDLEERAGYFERKSRKKAGMLHTFESIVGESEAMRIMKKRGRGFAGSREPILILGESGTGKELVAQALHSAGDRSGKPFVTVNCAALPHELVESELFGYAAGAFTGAGAGGMKGKFELADGGSIFLDEIGELSLPMQAKLLRVLETGEIQKLAHPGRLHSDFRLIAATNKNIAESVNEGKFREDLYHRLSILELIVPPLREHVGDIPLLAGHFIEQGAGHKRAQEIHIDNEVYRLFRLYPWRGNVRELKNVLTYALYSLGDTGDILTPGHLPERFLQEFRRKCRNEGVEAEEESTDMPFFPENETLASIGARSERQALQAALRRTEYNKTLAARMLGISRNKLYKKMRELGLRDSLREATG
jgi:transcriptional regulator with PAS, ATPase and Fis domain